MPKDKKAVARPVISLPNKDKTLRELSDDALRVTAAGGPHAQKTPPDPLYPK